MGVWQIGTPDSMSKIMGRDLHRILQMQIRRSSAQPLSPLLLAGVKQSNTTTARGKLRCMQQLTLLHAASFSFVAGRHQAVKHHHCMRQTSLHAANNIVACSLLFFCCWQASSSQTPPLRAANIVACSDSNCCM